MDELLAKTSRTVIVAGALTIGILFIILNDPPRDVCDAQIERFKKSQAGFLYPAIKAT